jgi:hypothetical protein
LLFKLAISSQTHSEMGAIGITNAFSDRPSRRRPEPAQHAMKS